MTWSAEWQGCREHAARSNPRCVLCRVVGAIGRDLLQPEDVDPFVGRTIGNGCVIRELIGQGGMGSVYEAEQTSLGRRVAVKFLKPDLLRDELSTRRFYNEARAASRLNHPNSVAVFDFGATDDGVPFIVMEHLSGADLAAVLHAEGPLESTRVCTIARAVLAALGEAHALGILHRDLKPENVILVRQLDGSERVKVVDFGLARLVLDARLTEPNTILGTPFYMAPEQFVGAEIDGRADLYALGVMMFELLTGRVPFEGEQPVALAHQHVNVAPPDPRRFAAIDDELAEVVLKALAKSPRDRFESAMAMAQAIARVTEVPPRISSDRVRTRPPVTSSLVAVDPVVDELDRVVLQLRAAPVVVVAGRTGSGRSTTLSAFAERARRACSVARCGAEPLGGAPAYAPLRELAAGLFAACDGDDTGLDFSPLERAGYAELVAPGGMRGVPHASRAGAVGEALAAFVRRAARRAPSGRVVLLVDDATAFDMLSLQALEVASLRTADVAVFVVVTDEEGLPLQFSQAPRFVVGARATRVPLHSALLRRLRYAPGEAPTPAECVATLLDRADSGARLALQATAVLGGPSSYDALEALGCTRAERDVEAAVATGLATHDGVRCELHALVRELVAAAIPAEVRRTLHDRALGFHTDEGAPIETRAHHAAYGSDGFVALLLLEQAGTLALRRGDPAASARWFGRGLERARLELALSGDETFEAGVLTFARKLAEALVAADRLHEAEGILLEAEGVIGPNSPERAPIWLLRARIAARRGVNAVRLFEEVLATDRAERDPAFFAECGRGLAEARLGAADPRGAVAALREVQRAEDRADAPPDARSRTALATALALEVAAGPGSAVRAELERAAALARRAGAPALEARALGELAQRIRLEPDLGAALDALERAVSLAAEGGDVDAARGFEADLAAVRARIAPGAIDVGRGVVLIVEDDVELQETLWSCLTDEGYRVHVASSGKHALRLLDGIDRPIAILVDLMMPVMNGWDFVAAVRDNPTFADIPVTVLSAVAGKAPDGVHRLQKPVDLQDLLRLLAAAEAPAFLGRGRDLAAPA